MRRWMAIAAFALVLAVPLWAQHGGGGGHGGGGFGGGHGGGFGGGHAGGFGGGGHVGGFSGGFAGRGSSESPNAYAYSGPLSQANSARRFTAPPTSVFNHPRTGGFTPPTSPLVRQPFASNGRGFNRNGRGGVNFRIRSYPYWRYGWGYPYYWGYGYWDPWWSWWWDQDDSNYDNDYNNNVATAEQMNEDSLRQQQMLQQEQTDGDQDAYQNAYDQGYADAQAQNQPKRPDAYANVRAPLDPERMQQRGDHPRTADSAMRSTVLIFRDQHKQEVENYAIVGETLWDFTPQQTVKIPLSDLDIPATVKANQDRGVTFSVPSSDQGE